MYVYENGSNRERERNGARVNCMDCIYESFHMMHALQLQEEHFIAYENQT